MQRTINRLPDRLLVRIASRNYAKVQKRMTSKDMGYQPFGWDWPTARMLHPLHCRHADRCKAELKRRADAAGLTLAAYGLMLGLIKQK